eukprot:TRINITY_DN22430_c0_g1_i2.p1 TRINITY_DN22430_c0_g1~~TRINITY_DN22430_c0_g1_i2.p1  ORF type:complete len:721 (-),score=128.18 TRINITY_DN22430_c0_g1_i2:241-2403(-)
MANWWDAPEGSGEAGEAWSKTTWKDTSGWDSATGGATGEGDVTVVAPSSDDGWKSSTAWNGGCDGGTAGTNWSSGCHGGTTESWGGHGGDASHNAATAANSDNTTLTGAPGLELDPAPPGFDAPVVDPIADAWTNPTTDKPAVDAVNGAWGTTTADAWSDTPPAHDFWNAQTWNKENGVLSRKEEWELARDDEALFVERLGSSAGLDFARYESISVNVSGSNAEACPKCASFEEMYEMFQDIMPVALMDNVRRCKYVLPTPVQKYAIPVGLVGRDVMCSAQTGSGKTAAFLIPVIGRMMQSRSESAGEPVGALTVPFEGKCRPHTLVLTPTRELCVQIYEEAQKFCHRTPYIPAVLYGGSKPKGQLEVIAKGCDVMVATPGRLDDFIKRGVVSVEGVSVLVLDEADRMLDMGFEPQVRSIVEKHGMPGQELRQTMMFSATFPERIQHLAQEYLYDYIWIGVGIIGGAVDTVDQQLIQVAPAEKFSKLIEVLDQFFSTRDDLANKEFKPRAMIFVNAKNTAKFLDEKLFELKIDTGALHGDLDQTERETNLLRFRQGKIDVMVATDVAARGIDVEGVALVINYDMPQEIDTYIHRVGRTGRIGNRGQALTFISCDENGACLEGANVLKGLVQVMTDANSTLPGWLEGLIEQANASGREWGGTDVRGGSTQRYQWTAGGDEKEGSGDGWANWKSKDQDQADQQWQKGNSWQAGEDKQDSTWS